MTEIFTVAGYERTRDSLPYGDSYLVEMPTTPLDFLAIRILFLPATLMVCIWVGFCRIVNNIIN